MQDKNSQNFSEKNIPFNKPFFSGKELEYITQSIEKYKHIAGDGHFTKLCNSWLEEKLNCNKALLTNSCTAALEMAAILCDIKPGDEVIMPSFTFVSTANAFCLRGAKPVFVDINHETLNIDETKIEGAVTKKTKAIVPVHYAGYPCNMDTIMDIAKKYNLFVVEDAAQGLLSTYKNKPLGTIGDLGTLSFHETKNIISGEGGAILINNQNFIERAEIIREKGTNRAKFFRGEIDKYSWYDIGSSYLPSDLIAAFLYAQFENANKIVKKRYEAFDFYFKKLQKMAKKGFIKLPFYDEKNSHNGHIFYIIVKSSEERTKLLAYLKQNNINAVFHYLPLHTSCMGKKFGYKTGDFSVTEDIAARLIRLPLYFNITEGEQKKIIKKLFEFFI